MYLIRPDFVVDLLNAHFSGSHISTLHTEKHSNVLNCYFCISENVAAQKVLLY